MYYLPEIPQTNKSGNSIQIDYDIRNYAEQTAVHHRLCLNSLSLDANFNKDHRWKGSWKEKGKEKLENIFVTCRRGTTSDVTFSDNYPSAFRELTKIEIERILKQLK